MLYTPRLFRFFKAVNNFLHTAGDRRGAGLLS